MVRLKPLGPLALFTMHWRGPRPQRPYPFCLQNVKRLQPHHLRCLQHHLRCLQDPKDSKANRCSKSKGPL